jgi:outer membrane protein insertion porin family
MFFVLVPSLALAAEPTLEFHGNAKISSAELRTYLFAESSTFEDGAGVSQEMVERAALLISAYYWDRGYANVRVADPTIDQGKRRVDFTITTEGDKFTIKSVALKGTLLKSERSFLAMLAIKPNAVFSRTVIANDREKLSRYYEDRSYASVNVLPLTKIDLASKTIALTFEIDPGVPTFIEAIDVVGNTTTSADQIIAQLGLAVGEPFHGTRLVDGKARLKWSFPEVVISTMKGTSPDAVKITIEVDE